MVTVYAPPFLDEGLAAPGFVLALRSGDREFEAFVTRRLPSIERGARSFFVDVRGEGECLLTFSGGRAFLCLWPWPLAERFPIDCMEVVADRGRFAGAGWL
jgi:hypothetical protein